MDRNKSDQLLNELFEYVELENDGIKLTEIQEERYVELYNILVKENIEIPFQVVL